MSDNAAGLSRTLRIRNQRGLHARASAKFVQCADSFDAEVNVTRDGQTVGGPSIMGLMMLAAGVGSDIEALAAIEALVGNGFGEGLDESV